MSHASCAPEILKDKRASYGEGIVATLSAQLVVAFGRGFSEKNLRRMVQFAETFAQAVPANLVQMTCRLALQAAGSESLFPLLTSGRALMLAQEVSNSMMRTKLFFIAALVLAIGWTGAGAAWGLLSQPAPEPGQGPQVNPTKTEPRADPLVLLIGS